MNIVEILEGSNKTILENLDSLAKVYFERKGKKLNRGCSSCIAAMILSLKNVYKMTEFKFARHAASYKNRKGDKTTISNSTMTDEKALNFLKTDPSRIKLFSEFPSNWEELVEGKIETEEEKEKRFAMEAELKQTGEEGTEENTSGESGEETEENTSGGESEISREDLMKLSLKDLREMYPEVKATSIKDFVEKVLA